MAINLNAGDLAIVTSGKGANNVRNKPNGTVKGQIPEHAVLAILPRPADWSGAYPHDDGVHVWWYVRGTTDKKLASDRFEYQAPGLEVRFERMRYTQWNDRGHG